MSTTTLRVKNAPGFRVDASKLLPAALAALSTDDIARLRLSAGNETCEAGDLFDITRSDGDALVLIIGGETRWLDRIGAQMAEGRLTVQGMGGDYAGLGMSGGELHIDGDAGRFTGCEMRGGRLTIAGNSGDFAAGALPGDMEGMTGGTLTIHGHAGARLADRMRRGLVIVGGDAGDFAASRIVAGTVCVAGCVGAHYAYGMRRGTLLLAREPDHLPPTFVAGGHGFQVFWSLLVRSLAREIAPFSTLDTHALPRRHAGDLAVDGRGELLIAQS
ncbi:Formyltransferase/hydrolase complex Fhc subunit C [Caballeronia terrestris]|uniref:Formyltransferase/hydrolase complex Fhc subunit C n=1 Tax=Caballeronia terrestris TaxID=1226301 RepID=A0A158F421_9BURK|nr:formylmethanofuran dehydrogenase subunit C [Caballeronia terrestris]SAL14524.1 Formyltransferase/hydrolase complex Fhc subunit C [Caballeronia terrestris]